MFTPFKTHARNYAMNAAGSAGTYAKPVIIQGPDSDEPVSACSATTTSLQFLAL